MMGINNTLSSTFLLLITSLALLVIAIFIRLTSEGPVLYWSDRVGGNNKIYKIYKMPKFRSMLIGTPNIATDSLNSPVSYLSPIRWFFASN
jgi:O-antigen biosynthesis protein WbqP